MECSFNCDSEVGGQGCGCDRSFCRQCEPRGEGSSWLCMDESDPEEGCGDCCKECFHRAGGPHRGGVCSFSRRSQDESRRAEKGDLAAARAAWESLARLVGASVAAQLDREGFFEDFMEERSNQRLVRELATMSGGSFGGVVEDYNLLTGCSTMHPCHERTCGACAAGRSV